MARQLVDQSKAPGGAADLAAAQALINARGGEALLSTAQVAAVLGRAIATIRDWRTRRVGPRYCRGRGFPMYRWADVEAWLNGTAVDPSTTVDTAVKGGAA